MPYINHYTAPASISRPTPLNPGGLCSIIFFLWEDVEQWPKYDPLTGKIADSVQLKAGKSFYVIEATENDRTLKEEQQQSIAGPYHNISVTCRLGGNTNNATLALGVYQYRQFGLIVKDRNGEQRLIGDESGGARINFGYTSGDWSEQRHRPITWQWKNPMPAPIYHDGGITLVPPTCSEYTLIASFRVGAVGAPMVNGDTTYTNALLANTNFVCFADGIYIHQVTDTDTQRYCTKDYADDTITFNGGVFGPPDTDPGEVIAIYKAI